MGSKSTTTNSPTFQTGSETTTPWAPQADALTKAFDEAQANYEGFKANPYTGQFAAGPTQQQYDAYGNAYNQAKNAQPYASGMLSEGASNAGSGWDAANSALGGLGSFLGSDRVGDNINSANRYASGFDMNAAMLDANRNAAENAIPNLYRNAASAGGINSDRSALGQGVVERGLAERRLALNNENYGKGLSLAQDDQSRLLQALGLQGSQGQSLGQAGVNEQTGAIEAQSGLNKQMVGGADGSQGLDQAGINTMLQNYLGKFQMDNQALQSLMQIIGSNKWGENKQSTSISSGGTQTTQKDPGIGSLIGGGLGTVGSLIKG